MYPIYLAFNNEPLDVNVSLATSYHLLSSFIISIASAEKDLLFRPWLLVTKGSMKRLYLLSCDGYITKKIKNDGIRKINGGCVILVQHGQIQKKLLSLACESKNVVIGRLD